MFENIMKFLKKLNKKEDKSVNNSKNAAKERLHLVLMQDRANVSADFLELMKQEIIEVIKKYIDVDEEAIDVRLTNKEKEDGTNGAPALYANIPILNIKNEARKVDVKDETEDPKEKIQEEKEEPSIEEKAEEVKEETAEVIEEKETETETNHEEENSEEVIIEKEEEKDTEEELKSKE